MNAPALATLGKLWAPDVSIPRAAGLALETGQEVSQPKAELTNTKIAPLCSENADHLGLGPCVSGCSPDSPAMTSAAGKICAQSSGETQASQGYPMMNDLGEGFHLIFHRKSTEEVHHGGNENPFGLPLPHSTGCLLNSIFSLLFNYLLIW